MASIGMTKLPKRLMKLPPKRTQKGRGMERIWSSICGLWGSCFTAGPAIKRVVAEAWPTYAAGRAGSSDDLRQRVQEASDECLVELAAGPLAQLLGRFFVGTRQLIRIARGHGYPGVADLDDARGQGDLRTGDAARIAAAVDALVVAEDGLGNLAAEERPHQRGTDDGGLRQ